MASSDKSHYSSLEMMAKKHSHSPSVDGHQHDGCEMKDDDATWAATNFGALDSATSRNFFESQDSSKNYQFAVNASWVVNWFLLGTTKSALRLNHCERVT